MKESMQEKKQSINNIIKKDAGIIIERTLSDVMPQRAVREQLEKLEMNGRVFVIAIGKAAWTMAKSAKEFLGTQLYKGLIVTKYDHIVEELPDFEMIEAGHPLPDENSVLGAKKAIALLKEVTAKDTVLFLLSGGGSALFELPEQGITLKDIQEINSKLLMSGAGIQEINVIRKKLSAVKGGKLAAYTGEAGAYAIILSDVLGDHDDMIASGLTYPDYAGAEEVLGIIRKYDIQLPDYIEKMLGSVRACPEEKVENYVVGSVKQLCKSAAEHAKSLGYRAEILTDNLTCEAKDAGVWLASMAKQEYEVPTAYIAGGETVVKVKGKGKGGRNQELALSAAIELTGIENVILFSLGSDGTDGPTDAAGGMVDGETFKKLKDMGTDCRQVLEENDAYHALEKVDGLIKTGPTGTNVNDVAMLLCRPF